MMTAERIGFVAWDVVAKVGVVEEECGEPNPLAVLGPPVAGVPVGEFGQTV
jgi:hypothetical protein